MKKKRMKIVIVAMSMILAITIIAPSSVANAKELTAANTVEDVSISNTSPITTKMVNPVRHRKKNVKTYTEWSGYKRISDNVKVESVGGSISAKKVASFSVVVSGNISGLGISTSGKVSSEIGYTINAVPNTTVYMGYKVKYKVETGINEIYDSTNGRIISSYARIRIRFLEISIYGSHWKSK